ncbi:hypothetical protein ASE17_02765 [Phenylobacterium sp. Root77]|uniref:DUF58 domain-containing protein n=1 Tax=unclassified Phenylobacterium TaxID=2640670 RepID=UPI0006F57E71|nr:MULTISPECIES: DUF58 domain-containing protein [unclassified Phenylobacterium]KQW71823.1 hypothetical protein ASC73_06990 [Phenylobacterium sp. Root1277]KQW94743.1 hypothetical protein ASC79_03135 [Phenylobacterium sp. Root1290]KRC44436.1 hypothetical protein ASE17_02765 [Phenylobacterium sp. Root77]
MIYPTRRAALAVAAGAPLALIAGSVAAQLWVIGALWAAGLLFLMALDAMLGAARDRLTLDALPQLSAAVARPGEAVFTARFGGKAPGAVEAALAAGARLGLERERVIAEVRDGVAQITAPFTPKRRGMVQLEALWLRWRGPLGLVWKQKTFALDYNLAVTTDLQWVREEAVRLFARNALFGAKAQIEVGEGSEFHALRDFQPGMDRRAVDWKQSARHALLLAKEFRTERNHNVVMALDCGRAMSEPVDGAPRIDRAINGALLLAHACLRSGDRAGLFAFDAAPRLSTGAVGGPSAFGVLQQMAGRIDYSAEETNYTLGLSVLSAELQRRSLIVVFTDFTDQTAAQLMIESVGRLVRRHLIMFVVLRDEELEEMVGAEPKAAEDVSRAVFAASLLRERDLVISRLRRLGVHIVEARAERIGPAVINAYLDLKRRDLL